MTDARMPERWLMDRRIQRLPDGHYRAFVNALLYAVANRSDGIIEPEDLGLIPGFGAGAAQGLVDAGLWQPRAPKGWLIVDFRATQSSKDELDLLERNRERERLKKQRQRDKTTDKGDVPRDGPGDSPPGQDGDVSPGTAQAGRPAGRQDGIEGQPSALSVVNARSAEWRGPGSSPYDEYN